MMVNEENSVILEFLEAKKYFDDKGLELIGTKEIYEEKVYLVKIKKVSK